MGMILPQHEGCPLGGVHQTRTFTGLGGQFVSCYRCHKTWAVKPEGFMPTWPDIEPASLPSVVRKDAR